MRLLAIVLGLSLAGWVAAVEEKHPYAVAPHNEEMHEEDHPEKVDVSSNVGPDKAVLAAEPERGLQLSPEAIRRMSLKTASLSDTHPSNLPRGALVHSGVETSVYRLQDGWYKAVSVSELGPGDTVVIQGAAILRLAELDVFRSSEEGHGH